MQRVKYEFVPGWMSDTDLAAIKEIAEREGYEHIVEIGSLLGKSAIAWATFAPEATVWCVDPFKGSLRSNFAEFDISHMKPKPSATDQYRALYSGFLYYTASYPNIKHLRCRSQNLFCEWPYELQADIVFLDGDHTKASVWNDLQVATYHLKAKVICGHDYGNRHTPDVTEAVDEWAKKERLRVKRYDGTYIFELENANKITSPKTAKADSTRELLPV